MIVDAGLPVRGTTKEEPGYKCCENCFHYRIRDIFLLGTKDESGRCVRHPEKAEDPVFHGRDCRLVYFCDEWEGVVEDAN